MLKHSRKNSKQTSRLVKDTIMKPLHAICIWGCADVLLLCGILLRKCCIYKAIVTLFYVFYILYFFRSIQTISKLKVYIEKRKQLENNDMKAIGMTCIYVSRADVLVVSLEYSNIQHSQQQTFRYNYCHLYVAL